MRENISLEFLFRTDMITIREFFLKLPRGVWSNVMFDVNAGDSLSRVRLYELSRPDGVMSIKVLESLTESVYKYAAIPCLQQLEASDMYIGTGGTADEALANCLGKIRTVTITELFNASGR